MTFIYRKICTTVSIIIYFAKKFLLQNIKFTNYLKYNKVLWVPIQCQYNEGQTKIKPTNQQKKGNTINLKLK